MSGRNSVLRQKPGRPLSRSYRMLASLAAALSLSACASSALYPYEPPVSPSAPRPTRQSLIADYADNLTAYEKVRSEYRERYARWETEGKAIEVDPRYPRMVREVEGILQLPLDRVLAVWRQTASGKQGERWDQLMRHVETQMREEYRPLYQRTVAWLGEFKTLQALSLWLAKEQTSLESQRIRIEALVLQRLARPQVCTTREVRPWLSVWIGSTAPTQESRTLITVCE